MTKRSFRLLQNAIAFSTLVVIFFCILSSIWVRIPALPAVLDAACVRLCVFVLMSRWVIF